MPTDPPPLLTLVTERLTDRRVKFALIGASAMAIHGVSRSTQDIDLLVSDRRVLADDFWSSLPSKVTIDVRSGDADDPLAGVVRCGSAGQRDVDVIVGRGAWEGELVARAQPTTYSGVELPVVQLPDLVLLKVYAGGSQDRWDVEQLLARPDRDAVIATLEERLAPLPAATRQVWARWRGDAQV